MARKENFRWRNNPGVIAQYFLDRNVKHGENVVLKPNEACVVVENGSVIGISTQTKMEVNPKAGILSKVFGQGQPNRAFLFVLLGPHDLLILVSGRTADGHDLSGMISLKVEFNTQDTPLLLQFPAKGESTIGIDNLVEAISPEINALVNAEVIGPHTLEQIRTNAELQEDLKASIRANLSKTMKTYGLQFINCYANWNQTEFDNLISMQNEVDNLRKHKTILDEQAQIEMEATLSKRKRELDLLHHIHVQDITVEAQRNIAAEIAEINAQKDLENSRWEALKSQKQNDLSLQHELQETDMQFALKASQHQIEIAKNEAEIAQIKHEQDLSMRRDNLILENKVDDEKAKRAMSMFDQVQENKRKRMELQSDLNIERQTQSDNLQAEMMRLAAENNALDSNVMQEFLKQQTEQKLADGSGSESSSTNSKSAEEENTIFSPDGKFKWDGNEWIAVNQNTDEAKKKNEINALNMQDSIVSGDIVHKTVINNDAATVTSAVITALQELGVIGQHNPTPQPPPVLEVELPPSFKIGDHVEYHSPTNSRWLDRCTVININDDGTYRIEVPKDNGIIETKFAVVIGTAPGTIRPASPPYSIGDKVLVNWKNYGTYYPGKIASEHDNHTFLIHFDDGDIEDHVEWGRIEKIPEDSNQIQEYVENISEAEYELIDAFKVFDENNTGTISAKKYFEILTEMGDEPISVEEVVKEFESLGIKWDTEINYRELAKLMVSGEENQIQQKPEVVIRDAEIKDGRLYGYAYDHPKLGEGPLSTSTIQNLTYDERATAKVETKNTVYVVGPTGWKEKPDNHPFNNHFSAGQQVKVEWKGSWWDALIREVSGNQYLIHYIGFDSSWDEWITVERMKNN